jgi:hypothetical protein
MTGVAQRIGCKRHAIVAVGGGRVIFFVEPGRRKWYNHAERVHPEPGIHYAEKIFESQAPGPENAPDAGVQP